MSELLETVPAAPHTRRRENTRSRLVRASLDVFVDKGLDGATIDDLVTAAGFTRGAFYSSFSKKEEVFDALFEAVTDEVIQNIHAAVEDAIERSGGLPPRPGTTGVGGDEMLAIFEAIRPFGRQWYLLYSDAVAHALRSREALAQLNEQRHRLRDAIALHLRRGLEATGERCEIGVDRLAQILIGVFVDLMVQEHLDGADVTELAGPVVVRILHAFIDPAPAPGEDGSAH